MSCPESEELLVRRMLPRCNPHRADRVRTWSLWQRRHGESVLRKYIRSQNHSLETDDDIFQSTMLTAFLEVERGRYELRPRVPFTAWGKGIARNKIREAWRQKQPHVPIEQKGKGHGADRQHDNGKQRADHCTQQDHHPAGASGEDIADEGSG